MLTRSEQLSGYLDAAGCGAPRCRLRATSSFASHENVGTVKRFSQSSAHDDNVANATAAVIGKPPRIQLVVGDSAGAPVPSGGTADAGGKSRSGNDSVDVTAIVEIKPTTLPKVSTSTTLAGIEPLERELGGVKITEYDELSAMFDGAIADLVSELGRLPGVGPKSAQRIAFHILQAEA